jgi:molecular chaperone GrpE
MSRRHDKKDMEQELAAREACEAEGESVERILDEGSDETVLETPDSIEDAKDRLVLELKDALLRLTAEFDNYQRRTQREKEQLYADSVADVALQWLPVLDNLERAAAVAGANPSAEAAPIADGIAMVLRQANETMARIGVEEVPALGTAFDPHLHNAVMHIEDESLGTSVVAEVFQKGFRCGGKVIRHSLVKVAN